MPFNILWFILTASVFNFIEVVKFLILDYFLGIPLSFVVISNYFYEPLLQSISTGSHEVKISDVIPVCYCFVPLKKKKIIFSQFWYVFQVGNLIYHINSEITLKGSWKSHYIKQSRRGNNELLKTGWKQLGIKPRSLCFKGQNVLQNSTRASQVGAKLVWFTYQQWGHNS